MAGEISFTLSERDYADAVQNQYRQRITSRRHLGWTLGFLALLVALFGYIDSCDLTSAIYTGAVYAALLVIVSGVAGVAGYFLVGKHARRMFRQQVIRPDSRISWTDEGFHNSNEYGSFAAKWNDFYGWREVRGSYMLLLHEDLYYLIPHDAISSEQSSDLEETLTRSGLATR
jgi:hypothetical protein